MSPRGHPFKKGIGPFKRGTTLEGVIRGNGGGLYMISHDFSYNLLVGAGHTDFLRPFQLAQPQALIYMKIMPFLCFRGGSAPRTPLAKASGRLGDFVPPDPPSLSFAETPDSF